MHVAMATLLKLYSKSAATCKESGQSNGSATYHWLLPPASATILITRGSVCRLPRLLRSAGLRGGSGISPQPGSCIGFHGNPTAVSGQFSKVLCLDHTSLDEGRGGEGRGGEGRGGEGRGGKGGERCLVLLKKLLKQAADNDQSVCSLPSQPLRQPACTSPGPQPPPSPGPPASPCTLTSTRPPGHQVRENTKVSE